VLRAVFALRGVRARVRVRVLRGVEPGYALR